MVQWRKVVKTSVSLLFIFLLLHIKNESMDRREIAAAQKNIEYVYGQQMSNMTARSYRLPVPIEGSFLEKERTGNYLY